MRVFVADARPPGGILPLLMRDCTRDFSPLKLAYVVPKAWPWQPSQFD